jgi:cytoskeletal protein CcmA (bactofilin family)
MIRMGRSSKNENISNETTEFQEQSATTNFPVSNEQQSPPANRSGAISESESMARDIKEGRLSGFVGAGTVLTGETNFTSMLRVDGHLTGRVTSDEGTLIIGSTGQVDANIDIAAAIVNGTVNGDVIASEKIELGRTARVVGNIQTPRLLMADGAILEGTCSMLKSKEMLEERAEERKQQFTTSNLSDEIAADTSDEDGFADASEEETADSYLETSETDADDEEDADEESASAAVI